MHQNAPLPDKKCQTSPPLGSEIPPSLDPPTRRLGRLAFPFLFIYDWNTVCG